MVALSDYSVRLCDVTLQSDLTNSQPSAEIEKARYSRYGYTHYADAVAYGIGSTGVARKASNLWWYSVQSTIESRGRQHWGNRVEYLDIVEDSGNLVIGTILYVSVGVFSQAEAGSESAANLSHKTIATG